MAVFQQHFWGYEVTYPDDWVHATHVDVEAFAMHPQALDTAYDGPHMGYLLIRAELNSYQTPIDALWLQYASKIAIMHSAKNVGSSPFAVGQAKGYEAEYFMPQRENKRLWMAVLAVGGIVLHFMVLHRKTEKADFQPIVSAMIASLRFAPSVEGVTHSPGGMLLPVGVQPIRAADIFPDAKPPDRWEAYQIPTGADALQIFYMREAPVFGWEVLAYTPYPNREPSIHYASIVLYKDGQGASVHLLPESETAPRGKIVIHYPSTPNKG